ncbi:MAG: ATP-grasp domain-containing protein [Bdellovibrio sp.]
MQKRIGILGGGQLARMLALAGAPLGFEMHILSPSKLDPAAQVTGFHHLGDPSKLEDLKKFLTQIDHLTFESEFFDMDVLQKALGSLAQAPGVFPNAGVMRDLQDRSSQKQLLITHGLATSPCMFVQRPLDLKTAFEKFKKGYVVKKVRGGYDGTGTFYVKSLQELEKLQVAFPGISIAESFVKFKRELATSVVCDGKKVHFLPLVESHQTDSRCDWVRGPVKHRAWNKLSLKIEKMLLKIGYQGVIAFELFDTGTNLLVNEIAPRVHNSAHYTQDALNFSQFALHLLAGTGAKLPRLELKTKCFVMMNLVGESYSSFVFPDVLEGNLHWYGKASNRPGRKMGHLNWVGARLVPLFKNALNERARIRK